jgi:hypothetical protein
MPPEGKAPAISPRTSSNDPRGGRAAARQPGGPHAPKHLCCCTTGSGGTRRTLADSVSAHQAQDQRPEALLTAAVSRMNIRSRPPARMRCHAAWCERWVRWPARTAGHGAVGDRRGLRQERSARRRGPRSTSRPIPTARLPAYTECEHRPRPAAHAQRQYPAPAARSSPTARQRRRSARRPPETLGGTAVIPGLETRP